MKQNGPVSNILPSIYQKLISSPYIDRKYDPIGHWTSLDGFHI